MYVWTKPPAAQFVVIINIVGLMETKSNLNNVY